MNKLTMEQIEELVKIIKTTQVDEGQTWAIIENNWYDRWTKGVPIESLGPIDNSSLLIGSNLKGDLLEGEHFVVIPDSVWKRLIQVYNGGPEILISVVKNLHNRYHVDLQIPFMLQFMKSSNLKNIIRLPAYKHETISSLKDRACKEFKLNPKDVRVWDYYNQKKYCELKDREYVMKSNFIENQHVLLEILDDPLLKRTVDLQSYPIQNDKVKSKYFHTIRSIESKKDLKENQKWCLLEKKWYDKWCNGDFNLGPIDNSGLIDGSPTNLKPGLSNDIDFIVVPYKVWNVLVEEYHGGPEISRNVIFNNNNKTLEIDFDYPLKPIHLVGDVQKDFYFYKRDTILSLKIAIGDTFTIKLEEFTLWIKDEEENKYIILLNDDEYLNDILQKTDRIIIEKVISQTYSLLIENSNQVVTPTLVNVEVKPNIGDILIDEKKIDLYSCKICDECKPQSYFCQNGHGTCLECLNEIILQKSACAYCRTPLSKDNVVRNLFYEEAMLLERVKCPNKNCMIDSMEYRYFLDTHQRECTFRPIKCTCGTEMCFNELDVHQISCPNRKYVCLHCKMLVNKGNLVTHIDKECSSIIPCPMKSLGCPEEIKRRDLEQHLTIESHMKYIKSIPDIMKEMEELKNENEKLKLQINQKSL